MFDPVTLTLQFGLLFENSNRATCNNFWTVRASALIFHMSISRDKPYRGYQHIWPVALALFFETFNPATCNNV